MPMTRETGKDRWKKVPKDYFKKRDRLQNLKLQLSGLACVLALGWWAIGVDWTGGRSSSNDLNGLRANHGELARVHTAWANKCETCHVPFEPIDGRPLLSSKSVAEGRSSDKLCNSCHAGPAHHSTMIASEVKGCAECHRDHQGREFSMVRLNDHECTSCHQALEGHIASGTKPGTSRMFGNVSRFNEKDHPPFRPEAALFDGAKPPRDKGKLKFNHALHMMPGIVRDAKETPYTVEQIPIAAERARYQKSGSAKDPVQLDCSSCHVLDATEIQATANPAVSSASLPSRNPGRYFLPISYANQCRACHTQTFDPRPDLKDLEVPHGVQPDQVISFLKRTYAAKVVDDPSVLNRKVTAIPLPGKSPAESTTGKLLDDAVTKATRFLFENRTSCKECHHIQDDAKGIASKVEPTKVPPIWFTHAAFGHTSHRGVSCRDCHARSYALEQDGKTLVKDSSKVATDVLIPAIDNCVQCHAPSKSPGGWFASSSSATTGGVSFDCTECHRYHNGDNLLQGYGAPAEDADHERTITEFLQGAGGRSLKATAEKSGKP
jgi:hypothetical protein